jgi:hypothetical protein
MLVEINRVLRPDGLLLLTTPNVTSRRNVTKMLLGHSPFLYASFNLTKDRHNREYSPSEVVALLSCAGFCPQKLVTSDVYFPLARFPLRLLLHEALTRCLLGLARHSHLRGDGIFVLARKAGPIVSRYPEQFYDLRP